MRSFKCHAPWSGWYKKGESFHHWKVGATISSCGEVELTSAFEATYHSRTDQPATGCDPCKEEAIKPLLPPKRK